MLFNIKNKSVWSFECALLVLLLLLQIIAEAVPIWKCNNDVEVVASSTEIPENLTQGPDECGWNGKPLPTKCDSTILQVVQVIEIGFNSNNPAPASFQLGEIEYGIDQPFPRESHLLKDIDLEAYKCHLNKSLTDLSDKVLQFNEMKIERRNVSIGPNLAAIFYRSIITCFWPDTRSAALDLYFEPIKIEFSPEPNCTPKDLLLPIKPKESNSYTHIGKAGRSTEIRSDFVHGASLNPFPSNIRLTFRELEILESIDFYNNFIDKIKSIGNSSITGFNWTPFFPNNVRSLAIGRRDELSIARIGPADEIQSFQVVGECGEFRIYTMSIQYRILNKVNKQCKSGTFPSTADGCPPADAVLPNTFPVADPPYWQP